MDRRQQLKAADDRWRANNPDKVRTRGRRSNWKRSGINVTVAEAALAAHNNGHCEICGSREAGGAGGWHVDHDHSTGKIRGILCSNCNRALGYFKDDSAVVHMASTYLKERA